MTDDLFLRHVLELLITFPAAIMAFLPAKNHLRLKIGGTITSVLVFWLHSPLSAPLPASSSA